MNPTVRLLLCTSLALAGAPAPAIPPPAPDEMRVQAVLGATTLSLAPLGIPFPYPEPVTVHLACIRVPARAGGVAAIAASRALAQRVPVGSWVVIRERPPRNADGSWRAEVSSRRGEVPVNLLLVAEGLALPSNEPAAGIDAGCDRELYGAALGHARSHRLGLWRSTRP